MHQLVAGLLVALDLVVELVGLIQSAEKLGVDVLTVQNGVEGLMYLLTECSKLLVGHWSIEETGFVSFCLVPSPSAPSIQVNEIDFQDSIMVLGFSEELNKELLEVGEWERLEGQTH